MRKSANRPPSFSTLVQAYFAEYLTQQRALSPQTIASYRDAFVLFLEFAQSRLGKSTAAIALADLTPELITAFLNYLEQQRHNCVRSRNARLAALRSFLKFAGRRDVSSLRVIEHALGIPVKRFERPMFGYLTREEILAVIDSPDETWTGQRDRLLFLMLYNTGARVSEITGVKVADVVLEDRAGCVHRKRVTPPRTFMVRLVVSDPGVSATASRSDCCGTLATSPRFHAAKRPDQVH